MAETRLVVPSIAEAIPEEKASLADNVAREIDWYAGAKRYPTNSRIVSEMLHRTADLVYVSGDTNIALVARLRNDDRIEQFPPILTKNSAQALYSIGRMWRRQMVSSGVDDPSVRLAVTSLARSQEEQDIISSDPAKLAAEFGTHPNAVAFDIDASGYYVADRQLGLVSIPHPDRPKKAVGNISAILKQGDAKAFDMPEPTQEYDPAVIDNLLELTDSLHKLNMINRIVEYVGTSNQCIHIAPNPKPFPWHMAG